MYRVRFHGRGGQGMKTASRILGSALFASGFEVQDAPRYGAERRGAPMFAYVRAARQPIHERGVITHPDLVVVADDTLVAVPAAGVTSGLGPRSIVLIATSEPIGAWRDRLSQARAILPLDSAMEGAGALGFVGASCAAAAARLLGVVAWVAIEEAITDELTPLGAAVVAENRRRARAAWEAFGSHEGLVEEGPESTTPVAARPDWVDVPQDPIALAAPDVHATATSVQVRTGLWRTVRPVLDPTRCHHCTWICAPLCPDGVIGVADDGTPAFDLEHCKGCMVCAAVCPAHAIETVPERGADRAEETRP